MIPRWCLKSFLLGTNFVRWVPARRSPATQ